MSDFFGIDFAADHDEYAEEGFIVEVQYELSKLLKAKGVSRSAFAKSMGVSPAYVSQMLGDEGANLTCRTIAKAFIALGEVPVIRAKSALSAADAAVAAAEINVVAASYLPGFIDDDDWSLAVRGDRRGWEGGEAAAPVVSPSNEDGWSNVIPLIRRAA